MGDIILVDVSDAIYRFTAHGPAGNLFHNAEPYIFGLKPTRFAASRILLIRFDPEYMRKLFALGYRMAKSGYPWAKAPPGFESP